jgi:hypothetical protein
MYVTKYGFEYELSAKIYYEASCSVSLMSLGTRSLLPSHYVLPHHQENAWTTHTRQKVTRRPQEHRHKQQEDPQCSPPDILQSHPRFQSFS